MTARTQRRRLALAWMVVDMMRIVVIMVEIVVSPPSTVFLNVP